MKLYEDFPKYKCHKVVRALKIIMVNRMENGGAILVFANMDYEAILVDKEYVEKHNPLAGGYFVVYDDDYLSFSPAKPFEAGYTLIK